MKIWYKGLVVSPSYLNLLGKIIYLQPMQQQLNFFNQSNVIFINKVI